MRRIVNLTLILLLFICCLCSCAKTDETNKDSIETKEEQKIVTGYQYSATDSEVKQAAVEGVREYLNPKLKNPSSLMINGATITSVDESSWENHKPLATYIVEVDISAQNSFGGYTRDIIGMKVQFNEFTGKFHAVTKSY